ncbi:Maf family protein [Alkalicoccus urumqiensis]|uniref:dTTP/UTP pyrophosphatase n=1 Tax=Alkalicoccus urumqiensis TaxID=1548213 RepID=A0A2P6MFB3_ALKUR|nr:Maf family protein [Alkalicoccus urumqiensis]PRO64968.1 septum formation inhibitor Maf [Alkalicoccus urumqiensis]
MKQLILASQSPRRVELLTLAGFTFDTIPSNVSEELAADVKTEDAAVLLALRKARAVFTANPEAVVIGSDTVVAVQDHILGKPADETDAAAMLRMLSGKTHHVYTGAAIVSAEKTETFTAVTEVDFFDLSDSDIEQYIQTKEPADKAGAYGIQGKGALFVREIRGDYYAVMGLPVARAARALKTYGVK